MCFVHMVFIASMTQNMLCLNLERFSSYKKLLLYFSEQSKTYAPSKVLVFDDS